MQAIKNTGLLTICNVCGLTGFAPAVSYSYNAGAGTLTVTDASVFGAGDGMKIEHVRVSDCNGTQLYEAITAADGDFTFNVAAMNNMQGFNINVTVVSNNHAMADLSAYGVGATAPAVGTLQYANKSQV